MTERTAALTVLKQLNKAGHEAFLVGGCVRDIILGLSPHDWDVTTHATPQQVMSIFPKTVLVGVSFGVVTVVIEDFQIQVSTYRSDGAYSDNRRPDSVTFTPSAADDVKRRDFTMNGLLCVGEADCSSVANYETSLAGSNTRYTVQAEESPDGESHTYGIMDFVGGMDDIKSRNIRCIGDPNERFREDALRMLRACRFAAQLGFTISPETVSAIQYNAALIKKVSVERITAELVKILTSPHPVNGLVPLVTTGLMEHLPFNETVNKSLANIMRRFGKFQTKDADLAMAMFFVHTDPTVFRVDYLLKQVLKMSNDHTSAVAGAVSTLYDMLFAGLFNLKHAQHRLKRMMRNPGALLGIELLEQNLLLHLPPFPEGDVREFRRLIKYLRALTPEEINPTKFVTGEDLIAMGMEPCREMGNILEDVEDMQLNGELRDRTHGLQVAKRYVSDFKQGVR